MPWLIVESVSSDEIRKMPTILAWTLLRHGLEPDQLHDKDAVMKALLEMILELARTEQVSSQAGDRVLQACMEAMDYYGWSELQVLVNAAKDVRREIEPAQITSTARGA